MGIVVDSQQERNVIALEGAVDIGSAAELKAELLRAIDSGKPVEISLQAATYLDVTAVQLLWAAQKLARQSEMQFACAGAMPAPLLEQLAEAGFPWFPTTFPPAVNAQ